MMKKVVEFLNSKHINLYDEFYLNGWLHRIEETANGYVLMTQGTSFNWHETQMSLDMIPYQDVEPITCKPKFMGVYYTVREIAYNKLVVDNDVWYGRKIDAVRYITHRCFNSRLEAMQYKEKLEEMED